MRRSLLAVQKVMINDKHVRGAPRAPVWGGRALAASAC